MFTGLANTPQTIVTANPNVLVVNSVIVCNLGAETIRFNLQKTRTQSPSSPITVSYIKEYQIMPYNTVDVAAEFGLEIFLTYSATPSVSDSLICFSNGYTQKFDCEITYTTLTELP